MLLAKFFLIVHAGLVDDWLDLAQIKELSVLHHVALPVEIVVIFPDLILLTVVLFVGGCLLLIVFILTRLEAVFLVLRCVVVLIVLIVVVVILTV